MKKLEKAEQARILRLRTQIFQGTRLSSFI
jgi:hypothetical protein